MDITIYCSYQQLVPITELKKKFNPDNPNEHSSEQIERLAEILKFQGVRKAAVISKRSDRLTAGHGRILSAERAGMSYYPVDYQDYTNEEQEYADLSADNAIAAWSAMSLAKVNAKLPELGPEFDIEMLGIKEFKLDPSELPELDIKEKELDENIHTDQECPSCGYKW